MTLADAGLEIEPTIAMRRGDQHAFQCAHCGTVVVVPSTKRPQLDACPNVGCARRDAGWIKQHLSRDCTLAGLRPVGVGVRR